MRKPDLKICPFCRAEGALRLACPNGNLFCEAGCQDCDYWLRERVKDIYEEIDGAYRIPGAIPWSLEALALAIEEVADRWNKRALAKYDQQ